MEKRMPDLPADLQKRDDIVLKIACIGDSIVEGAPYERERSFPAELARITGWEVLNYGISGALTEEVAAEEDLALGLMPDVLVILCGTNDACNAMFGARGMWANIREMAVRGTAAGAKPVVLSPVLIDEYKAARVIGPLGPLNQISEAANGEDPVGAQYASANRRLMELRELMVSECGREGFIFIDLQEEYRKCRSYYDGIHPDEEGYRFIAGFVAEELKKHI